MTDAKSPPISILFVCMGNICRSPTAEGVFRKLLADAGLEGRVTVDSAGTHGYHLGAPPDRRASAAARARGFDLSALRARRVVVEDFEAFDLIIAMDSDNLADLRAMAPEGGRAETRRLLEYSDGSHGHDVPDPYYGGLNGFELVLDLVERACGRLLEDLRGRLGA